ncbi:MULTISPECIES: hypothetical protein [Mycobacterium]|uniref:Uncharacterized protein n=1 Tax=Mycobacterium kiyosense TaxID=2871094 RepID=A0A9P3UXA5_9MYCO|nr:MULTISPECIES: hypothetical protein [Mycobacterium]BDB41824.1 hypothetical protein IWGMT90018_22700 [Mycobacterium kiyosense]BDE14883.1 hypothetical protein MKCMC460_37430 [Mycobacterium sp. 20KCMC460]GLB82256.1 hypothetical protein SRL2020028_15120 [Mycobacterium kiyosense]GLB89307.1 hypothetical protein SRL2020130_21240 [Mycobacterium kiyosense]GLB95960.1 hypothetical protein SRL2020226_27360 [Mycobacterium kiyosense]
MSGNRIHSGRATYALLLAAAMAGVTAAALTLLPWVVFDGPQVSLRWNGLGNYVGEHARYYGGEIDTVGAAGWIVLISSVLAVLALIGGTHLRRLWFLACGCAVIAVATPVLCLTFPALAVREVRDAVGFSAVDDRYLLNSGVLVAVAAATSVLFVCAALIGPRQPQVAQDD